MKKILLITAVLGVFLFTTAAFADESGVPFDLQDVRAYLGKMFGKIDGQINDLQTQVDNLGSQSGQLHLIDANGQDLGVLISSTPNSNNSIRTFGTFIFNQGIIVGIEERGFTNGPNSNNVKVKSIGGSYDTTIYFTELNCTGIPYISNALDHYDLVKNNSLRYFTTAGIYIHDGPSLPSRLEDNTGNCSNGSNILGDAYQLQEITLPFTEPLAWPLQIVTQ